jgi:hypothetical protein
MRSRYSRYRRRTAAGTSTSGHTIFGSTGWLFADLLLALALAFLLATTFGAPSSSKPPKPCCSTATATAKPTAHPTPKPTPTEPDALDLKYVAVPLTIDPGDISASAIQHTIATDPKLTGRQAGLVMLFAGGPDPNGPQWEQIDSQVWSILQSMNHNTLLFREAISRQFWNGKYPLTEVVLNVYLFKPKP